MANRGELRVVFLVVCQYFFRGDDVWSSEWLEIEDRGTSPVAARVSELVVSGLTLAGGGMPVAIAYINAAGYSRDSISALNFQSLLDNRHGLRL
ncbi:MAG: hypothetical protein HN341_01625 [Verrucomicrobia bacterium]|jgi:hypothetical protein|nr:hypothetical protein [Verrucomicrobiota bacterium]